ncbi:hypothetical protein F5B20DRAFT_582931 [Whalleya microplaca]|nr:hypothetical protein F5B20DRAFT_582931 [Whalleya microplaca]
MAADRAIAPDFDNYTQQPASNNSSSFTPLPLIRRTSTFGLFNSKGQGDEGADPVVTPPVEPSENHVHENMNYQNGDRQTPDQGQYEERNVYPSQSPPPQNQPPPQQHPAPTRGEVPDFNAPMNGRGADQPNGIQQHSAPAQPQHPQMYMGRGGPVGAAGPQPPFGQMPGQPNAPPPMNNSSHSFMSQVGGNPIQKFPPGTRWKLEESHLTEPLNRTRGVNRSRPAPNSPPQQQPGYFAYDKETEEPSPPPPGPGSSRQVPSRPRNNSNSIPPVSAQRFPDLFQPHGPEQPQPSPPQQAGPPPGQNQNQNLVNDEGRGRLNSLSKEMGVVAPVQVDEVSVSSFTSDEQNDKAKRSSGSFFSLSNRRNTGPETASQESSNQKRSFFGAMANQNHNHNHNHAPKAKSNLSHQESNGETAPVKKRLSELKGMIRGVGTAKDGAWADQPAKPSSPYSSRPSIQDPMQGPPGPQRPQGHPALQGQYGQPGSMGPPPPIGNIGRSSTSGPHPAQFQNPQNEDDRGRRPGGGGGGFLGGLFNKQASRSPDSRQQASQDQRPPQFPPQPGQLPPPRGPIGPHPMHAGQPMRPGTPGQQGMQRLFVPGQQTPPDGKDELTSPTVLSTQTARAVMLRRPSEITISSQGGPQTPGSRPPMPGPQGSETNVRPSTSQEATSTGPATQAGGENPGGPSGSNGPNQNPRHFSYQSSPDRPSVSESSPGPRNTPNRKPVGSGAAPALVTTLPKPDDSDTPPPSALDGRRLSSLPSGQQSPTLGALGHVRQSSLPPPNLVSSRLAGGAEFPPQHSVSSPDRQGPNQAPGSPQVRIGPSQLGPGGPGGPGNFSPSGAGPQRTMQQNPQNPGLNGPGPGPGPQRPGPGSAIPPHMQAQPPRPPPSPGLTPKNQQNIIKFFGVGGETKVKNPNQAQATKDKSTASKLFGAFKRSSKQHESNQQPAQQKPPPAGKQPPPQHMVMRPQQPGQPMPQQQPGMPRPPMPGPFPHGFYAPAPGRPQGALPPGQGRGQMPPPQMQPGGRVQTMPPMMQGGLGQPGRGQMPPPQQMQGPPRPQILNQARQMFGPRGEPQYDQVPIPRGYDAVHGYGNPGVPVPSPYNVASPPVHQFPPYQNVVPQQGQGVPPQQWDPRMVSPPHSVSPHGPPSIPSQSSQHGSGLGSNATQGSPTRPSQDVYQPGMALPDDQRTFLDMTPTPPPQQTPTDFQFDPQQTPHVSLQQAPHGQEFREPQQAKPQQTPVAQTPSSSNWGSAPESSPELLQRQLARNGSIQAEGDLSVSPPLGSVTDEQKAQPQHIATAMNNPHNQPRPQQTHQTVQFAFARNGNNNTTTTGPPPPPPSKKLPDIPLPPSSEPSNKPKHTHQHARNDSSLLQDANQVSFPAPAPAPVPQATTATATTTDSAGPANAIANPAARLVSKMSSIGISSSGGGGDEQRKANLSPEPPAQYGHERAMSVSPEPSRPFHHAASSHSLQVNVERANDLPRRDGEVEDDIYDATPRMNSSAPAHGQGHGHVSENTKYAGPDVGGSRSGAGGMHVNGGAVAAMGVGAGAGVGLAIENITGPDAETGAGADHQQQAVVISVEPEEKILVDQPVELAAVNDDDDDDGVPVMSATSYPGQEWNPYGAGEFGDWD